MSQLPVAEATRKQRLRLLDACLLELENAHERDLSHVPADVVRRFSSLIPALNVGMPIVQALDVVFGEQETLVNRDVDGPYGDGMYARGAGANGASARVVDAWPGDPLDAVGARQLTEKIRVATRQVCLLLLEAHERRAWVVLGYVRWEDYVASEFAFSRSRSYELLDQGRVILALQAAAGISEVPDISSYAAAQIKHDLPEIKARIRAQTLDVSADEAMQQVRDVVELYRTQTRNRAAETDAPRSRPAPAPAGPASSAMPPRTGDVGDLHDVVTWLASLPPVAVVASGLPDPGRYDPLLLMRASRWLCDLAAELDRFRRGNGAAHPAAGFLPAAAAELPAAAPLFVR